MQSEKQLFQEIASEYDVRIKTIEITPALHVDILVVKDVDVLLDKIDPEVFKRDERMPYWAELWPASIALGRHLCVHSIPSDAHVLELGCGLGLPAIVAANIGCTVVATDYEEPALKFARYNAVCNDVADRITFRMLDWRVPDLNERFPYIIASDIWFDRAHIPHLLRLVDESLEEGGTFLASDPCRWDIGSAFFEALVDRGYQHTNSTLRVDFEGAVSGVTIHQLQRS